MKLRNSFLLAALFAMAIMPAQAAFKVSVGGTVIEDNQAGDASLIEGRISYNDVVSGLNFEFNSGLSQSFNPFGTLTINNGGVGTGVYPATITLLVTDTDFSQPTGPVILETRVTGNTPTGGAIGTITSQGYYSASNTEFDLTGPSTGIASTTTFGTDADQSGLITFSAPFALTNVVTINLTGPGTSPDANTRNAVQITANLTANPVPEPGAIVLLGTALLGTVVVTRRKLNRV